MQITTNARPGGAVPADPAPRMRLFWWLLLAAVFVLQLPLPVRLAAGGFCLAAFWAGISSLNRLANVRRYARWFAGPATPPPPGYPAPPVPPAPPAGDAEQRKQVVAMAGRRAWPIGLGLGLAAVLTFSVVADAAFYRVNADTEECLAGANTEIAREHCLDDRQQRLQNILDRLTNRLDQTRSSLQPRAT